VDFFFSLLRGDERCLEEGVLSPGLVGCKNLGEGSGRVLRLELMDFEESIDLW
jgi:hypothetical protein